MKRIELSIKRRRKIGASLLVAGAGISMTVAGGCATSGNLMAPPTSSPIMVELCIEVEPETASVTVNETSVPDGECIDTEAGYTASIEATAEGYEGFIDEVEISASMTYTIEMIAEGSE
mgnify:CR=1 FL=1